MVEGGALLLSLGLVVSVALPVENLAVRLITQIAFACVGVFIHFRILKSGGYFPGAAGTMIHSKIIFASIAAAVILISSFLISIYLLYIR